MARLVKTHSTYIEGLIRWLDKLAKLESIKTITPGVISRSKGRSQNFNIKISRETKEGYKLLARKGISVQEVYLVTKMKKEDLLNVIKETSPYLDQQKKKFR